MMPDKVINDEGQNILIVISILNEVLAGLINFRVNKKVTEDFKDTVLIGADLIDCYVSRRGLAEGTATIAGGRKRKTMNVFQILILNSAFSKLEREPEELMNPTELNRGLLSLIDEGIPFLEREKTAYHCFSALERILIFCLEAKEGSRHSSSFSRF